MADEKYVEERGTPGWVTPVVVLAAVLGLAGIGVGWMASSHADAYQAAYENDMKTTKADYTSQIATVQQHEAQVDATDTQLQADLNTVTKKLNLTQGQLAKARRQEADDVQAVDTRVTCVATDLDSTKTDLNMAKS